jgi:hypothetical protein
MAKINKKHLNSNHIDNSSNEDKNDNKLKLVDNNITDKEQLIQLKKLIAQKINSPRMAKKAALILKEFFKKNIQ